MNRRRVARIWIPGLALVLASGCGTVAPAPLIPVSTSAPTTRPPVVLNPTPSLAPGDPGPFHTTGRGPDVPTRNAWFGAYADAASRNSAAEIAATTQFEATIGRPLAIVHSFHPWGDDFPTEFDNDIVDHGKIDLVSWASTNSISITSGAYDGAIRQFAQSVRDFQAPILLRYRWEMDRPNLTSTVGSGADFVAAWDHVRSIFTSVGATNAAWVWCPTSNAFANGTAESYYPGDANVDWICADVYPSTTDLSFAALMAPVLAFGKAHRRPIIIGELGVQEDATPDRAGWFRKVAPVLASQPQIKAVVYFSKSTTTKPVYDTTVGAPQATLVAFRALVTNPVLSAPVLK